ncbi:M23 family metallopeptidase [Microbacterium sp. NPDC055683]
MSERRTGTVLGLAAVPLAVVGMVFSIVLFGGTNDAAVCNPAPGSGSSVTIDPETVPDTEISGYGHEQLVNAAYIMQAGKDLGLGVRDQTIGVMTAMGESSLRVIDYGDAVGPDSRGLFQQRDNGAWGSYEDRMDPYISSTNYFNVLMTIEDRDNLAPTIVAHRVQRNADPYHYERYWDAAVAVVEGLSGVDTGLNPGNGGNTCSGGNTVPGEVNPLGWASPHAGPLTSPYGWRIHPITHERKFHYGVDLAPGCGEPIWSVNDGVVIDRGFDSGGNGYLTIDHGGGVTTRYLHMYDSGMFVNVGDAVKGGQEIAEEGSSGQSTGCHLHFEVLVNGENVDPAEFMAEVGITLG